jgi:hypothetical protein
MVKHLIRKIMTLQDAILKFPDPKFTVWYRTKFPKREFQIAALFTFAVGFVSTAIKAKKIVTGIATLLFLIILLPAGACHFIAWQLLRSVERKRADAMGISLQEYLQLFS